MSQSPGLQALAVLRVSLGSPLGFIHSPGVARGPALHVLVSGVPFRRVRQVIRKSSSSFVGWGAGATARQGGRMGGP